MVEEQEENHHTWQRRAGCMHPLRAYALNQFLLGSSRDDSIIGRSSWVAAARRGSGCSYNPLLRRTSPGVTRSLTFSPPDFPAKWMGERPHRAPAAASISPPFWPA